METTHVTCLNNTDPILMVDDSPLDIDIARRFYEYSELKNPLTALKSGKEFLDYMDRVKAREEPMPALVLLDINMPGLNGFETLGELRQHSEFVSIPIIVMLTNSDSPEDIKKSEKLGANGFRTKSFEFKEYVEFFNSLSPKN